MFYSCDDNGNPVGIEGGSSDDSSYASVIQPIFNANCGNCHLGSSSGGLNLSSYSNLMSDDVIVPGDLAASKLYDRITRNEGASGFMPEDGNSLSDSQIQLIETWIEEGALEEPNE